MPFAQLNYQEKVGNSNLTISEIGCFVTADANLLQKIGIEEAPDALNAFYEQHNLYSYDLTDRANDDITWSTVTKFHPQLVVKQIGTGGFPDSDLAIVEFRYKDHLGQIVTHFCAVNHAADRSIIDSWDGKVKTPAEYESVYGQPIVWATFENNVPTPEPAPAQAAPVSAPAAVVKTPAAQPAPAPSDPKQIFLPPSVWIWHVYKPGGPYTLPYAIGALDPKLFNGLTFDIKGNPAPNIYLIQTQDFGEVAIYAGPDTVAQFPGTGHGEGESLPVAEVVPAPTPVPAAEPQQSIVYARFPEPMQLITKAGAQRINFVSGTIVDDIPEGTPFVAVGKATLPNNDTYYMNDNDFGIADETQRTPITVGIKTVFLGEAPAPQPEAPASAEQSEPAPTEPASATEAPAQPEPVATPAPAGTDPLWKRTFEPIIKGDSKENPRSIDYVATDDIDIYDFATGNDVRHVPKKMKVPVVGTWIFANHRYYLAESSFKKGTAYGFPVTSLRRMKAKDTPYNTGDDINQIEQEVVELSRSKHAAIKAGASAQGWISRLRKK